MPRLIEATSLEGRKLRANLEAATLIVEGPETVIAGVPVEVTVIWWGHVKITVRGAMDEVLARPSVGFGTVGPYGPGQLEIIPAPRSRLLRWIDGFRRARPSPAGSLGSGFEAVRPRAPGPKNARDGGPVPPLPPRDNGRRPYSDPPPQDWSTWPE